MPEQHSQASMSSDIQKNVTECLSETLLNSELSIEMFNITAYKQSLYEYQFCENTKNLRTNDICTDLLSSNKNMTCDSYLEIDSASHSLAPLFHDPTVKTQPVKLDKSIATNCVTRGFTSSTTSSKSPKYKSIIMKLKKKLNRQRVAMHRIQKQHETSKTHNTISSDIQHICTQASKYLPAQVLSFFQAQLRASVVKGPRGRRWSKKDKLLALAMHYSGPKAYRFLATVFHLPSVKLLRKWISSFRITTGICKDVISYLKRKFSIMSQSDKLCALVFDEMSVKSAMRYDPTYDCFRVIEDFGNENRTAAIANQALVLMIRGITSTWK